MEQKKADHIGQPLSKPQHALKHEETIAQTKYFYVGFTSIK
jgi:hypothetical protein